ncbi:origin recognition complex subunit 3, partial [Brachionus plicatilis]
EYIRIHKPSYLNIPVAAISKTPRNSRRKSVSQSAKKSKRQSTVHLKENTDILIDVFNVFEEKIKKTKQEIHHDLFESTYDNIVQYFDYYAFKRAVCTSSSEDIIFNPVCNVIPTIALFTGINTQDYAYLCQNLRIKLEENFTQNIFFINEKNSANIKTLVNSIFSQWESIVDLEEKLVTRNLFTFRYLFDSIKTENDDDVRSESVIFFFKQFELIPKETIECFVSLISCHMESLPIYFIIELASQTNIIQEQLSSSVISKFCIKKLYLMSPDQYVDRFIEKKESELILEISIDQKNYK